MYGEFHIFRCFLHGLSLQSLSTRLWEAVGICRHRLKAPVFLQLVERDCTSLGRALCSPPGQSPGESDLPGISMLDMYQEFLKALLNVILHRELPVWEGPKHREETTWGSWVRSTQSAVNLRQLSCMQTMNPPQHSLRHLLHLRDLLKWIDPQLESNQNEKVFNQWISMNVIRDQNLF